MDPDPAYHYDADPDTAQHFDADPDPAYHCDPDPTFRFDAGLCGSGSAILIATFILFEANRLARKIDELS